MPGITLDLLLKDDKGKRLMLAPGITDKEKAHGFVDKAFALADATADVRAAEEALVAFSKKPKPTGPAYVPLTGLDNGDRCGWHMEARTGKERFCAITKGHDLKPGIGAGHVFEEPTPAKVAK